jgi:2Fe-2S ferredoxin
MPIITFIEHDGTEHKIEAENGTNLMTLATQNSVPGIDGDCGGACACATCHVFVDPAWAGRVGGVGSEIEGDLLSFADGANEQSRLGCQIEVSDALDGLVVRLPVGQH